MSDDANDDTEGLTRGWDTVYSTVQISAIVGAIIYIIFELFRPYRDGKTPAYGGNVIAQERLGKGSDGGLPHRPNHWFGWLRPLLSVDADGQLLRLVGLDAYVVLRYLRMQCRLSGTAAAFSLVILMPSYETGGEDLDSDFYRVTMSNLSDASPRFWIPTILGIFYGCHALWLIYQEYEAFVRLRTTFMAEGSEDTSPQGRYTILVENIPLHLQSPSLLRGYFEYLFPGKIHSSVLCVQAKDIQNLLTTREDVARRLETAYVTEERCPEKKPLMITPPYDDMEGTMATLTGEEPAAGKAARCFQCCALCGCCGCNCSGPHKVEMVPFLEEILRRLNHLAAEKQGILRDELAELDSFTASSLDRTDADDDLAKKPVAVVADPDAPAEKKGSGGLFAFGKLRKDNDTTPLHEPLGPSEYFSGEDPHTAEAVTTQAHGICGRVSGTAFVTFTSLAAKQAAVQVLMSNKSQITAEDAAEPRDIIWHDIHQPMSAASKNRIVASAFFTTLFVFFAIPVAACASASLDSIEAVLPPLSMFRGNYLYTTLGSFLPTIASLALLSIVPMLFKISAENFEFFKTRQQVQMMVFERNYTLVMVYTYITLTAGSVFDALAEIIADPFSILSVLGNTIPGTAAYFINVIALKTFQGAIMELARLVPHIIYWYFSRKGDKDLGPRDLIKRDSPNAVAYGMLVPGFMLVALVAYLLELICPAIQSFAFLYFLFQYTVWKHQFIYVYERPSESGGNIVFFRLYRRTFTAILIGQLTLIAYLLIRQAFWPAIVSIIMPVGTLIFASYLKRTYEPQAAFLSYERAVLVDQQSSSVEALQADTYVQPAIKDMEPAVAAKPGGEPDRNAEEGKVGDRQSSVGSKGVLVEAARPE